MSSILPQLHDPYAVALMYLSGELNEPDRLAVERLLANDAALRAQMESLRATQQRIEAALGQWDQASPPAMSQDAALRQVSPAITRWLSQGQTPTPMSSPRPTLRLLRWAYPLAAAAMIALSCGIWLHHRQLAKVPNAQPLPAPVKLATIDDHSREQQEQALARSLFGGDSALRNVELTQDLHQTGDFLPQLIDEGQSP